MHLYVYVYIYLQPKRPAFIEVFQNNQVLQTLSLKFRQGAETTKGAENEASRGWLNIYQYLSWESI